jgi:hypothetical protein
MILLAKTLHFAGLSRDRRERYSTIDLVLIAKDQMTCTDY